jgi:radical SAM superfamily enzyme YgiQ (UPF0313 family)
LLITDDNFLVDKKRGLEIAKKISNLSEDITWDCECSANILNSLTDDELKILEKSGLRLISIGIESGSPRIIKSIKKNVNIAEVLNLNKRLRKFKGLIAKYNFMTGYPNETYSDLKKTTNLVLKLIKDNPQAICQSLFSIAPYPGTEFYDQAIKNGFIPPNNFEEWSNFNPEDWIDISPWINKKRKWKLKKLYYASFFIDKKLELYSTGLLKTIIKISRLILSPFAKIIFKNP